MTELEEQSITSVDHEWVSVQMGRVVEAVRPFVHLLPFIDFSIMQLMLASGSWREEEEGLSSESIRDAGGEDVARPGAGRVAGPRAWKGAIAWRGAGPVNDG